MENFTSSNKETVPQIAQMRPRSSNSIQDHYGVPIASSPDSFETRNAIYRSHLRTPPPVATHIRRHSSNRPYNFEDWNDPRLALRYSPNRSLSQNPWYDMDLTAKESAMADSLRDGIRNLEESSARLPPSSTKMMARYSNDDAKNVRSTNSTSFGLFGKKGNKLRKERPKEGRLRKERPKAKEGKSRKEKPGGPKELIQLPKGAVSRTTNTGARYIAITIPIEEPRPEKLSHKSSRRDTRESGDGERQIPGRAGKRSISFLHPVVEMSESSSLPMLKLSSEPGISGGVNHERAISATSGTLATEIVGAEAARTLENFYRQQNRGSRPDWMSSAKSGMTRNSRSCFDFPTIARQDSFHELRYLAATAESTATSDHSRGITSVSAAQSLQKVTTPPRRPLTMQQELAEISSQPAEEAQKVLDSILTSMPSTEALSTVRTAQSYGEALVEVGEVRYSPKPRSPAPSTIIDISGARALVINRPATAPPYQARPIKTNILKRHSTNSQSNSMAITSLASSGDHSDFESTDSLPKSRKERVQVRKSRDMALYYIESTKHRRKSTPWNYDYRPSAVDLTTFDSPDCDKENRIPTSPKLKRVEGLSSKASTNSGNVPQDDKELTEQTNLESRMDNRNILAPLAMNPVTHSDKFRKRDFENQGKRNEIQDYIEGTIQPSPRIPARSGSKRRGANISIDSTSTARFLMDRVEEKEFDNMSGRDEDIDEPTTPLTAFPPSRMGPKGGSVLLSDRARYAMKPDEDAVEPNGRSQEPEFGRPSSLDSRREQTVFDVCATVLRESNNEFIISNSPSRTPSIQQINPQDITTTGRSDIALAPVRTVAALPAYTGYVNESDLPYRHSIPDISSIRRSPSATQANKTPQKPQIPTPADSSVTSSLLVIQSDHTTVSTIPGSRTMPKYKSDESLPGSSALDQMRSDRRAKRNHTLKEKEKTSLTMELERRLSVVERNNLILMKALTGFAGSIKNLESLYPKEGES